jgi:hypothetical protein
MGAVERAPTLPLLAAHALSRVALVDLVATFACSMLPVLLRTTAVCSRHIAVINAVGNNSIIKGSGLEPGIRLLEAPLPRKTGCWTKACSTSG